MFSHCTALFWNDERVSEAIVVNISSCKSCTGFVQCLNCPFPMNHPTKQHPAYRLMIFPIIVMLRLAKCYHCTYFSLPAAVSNYLFSIVSFYTEACRPLHTYRLLIIEQKLISSKHVSWGSKEVLFRNIGR